MSNINISLPEKNIHTHLDSIGAVELRYVSVGDVRNFASITKCSSEARTATVHIIHQQLLRPTLSIDELSSLNDEDIIQLANALSTSEPSVFYTEQLRITSFEGFVEALHEGQKRFIDNFRDTLPKITDMAPLGSQMAELARQSIGDILVPSGVIDITKNSERMLQATFATLDLSYMSRLIQAQSSAISAMMKDSILPNLEFFNHVPEILRSINAMRVGYGAETIDFMARHRWFVSPNISESLVYEIKKLSESGGNQRKNINNLFVEYFEYNDWEILDIFLEDWSSNPLFSSRIKIVSDVFQTIKATHETKINATNVVLPTLIVQIDGILKDFIEHNTGEIPNDKLKIKTLKDAGLAETDSDLYAQAIDGLLNILFQSSTTGKPLTVQFYLNRHKIIHAEYIRYGRKDYLIRVLMMMDMLACMENINQEETTRT